MFDEEERLHRLPAGPTMRHDALDEGADHPGRELGLTAYMCTVGENLGRTASKCRE